MKNFFKKSASVSGSKNSNEKVGVEPAPDSQTQESSVDKFDFDSLSEEEWKQLEKGDLAECDLRGRSLFYEIKGEDTYENEVYYHAYFSTKEKAELVLAYFNKKISEHADGFLDYYWINEWSYEKFSQNMNFRFEKLDERRAAFRYNIDHLHSVTAEAVKIFKAKMNRVTEEELRSYYFTKFDGAENPCDTDFFAKLYFEVTYALEKFIIGVAVNANDGYRVSSFCDEFDTYQKFMDWINGDMEALVNHYFQVFKGKIDCLVDKLEDMD